MKPNKSSKSVAFVLVALVTCFSIISISASFSEARMGGGRSGGSRGFRGFGGARSQPAPQSRPQSYQQRPGQTTPGYANPQQQTPGSGGFMRNMLGGMAGGMLGSLLFRSIGNAGGMNGLNDGYGGTGGTGGGGIGFLEILLLLGAGYLAYRWYMARKTMASYGASGASGGDTSFRTLTGASAGSVQMPVGEEAHAEHMRETDSQFDLAVFKDERMDEFLRLQASWNFRDLSSVAPLLGTELRQQLESDIAHLKASGRINRIENIAVRGTELVEVWQERGLEYATLRFNANLIDYTIDEKSEALVEGSKTQPVKFSENWTFVRQFDSVSAVNPWKLSAIES